MLKFTKIILLFFAVVFAAASNARAESASCYIMDGSPYFIELAHDYEGQFNPLNANIKFSLVISDFVDRIKKCGDDRMAQKIIRDKDVFSIGKIKVNGKEVEFKNLKKTKDEFAFDIPLKKGFNLIEMDIRDSFGMPIALENGAAELKLWAGDKKIKVTAVDDKAKPVENASVELLLKARSMNARNITLTDKNGVAEFSNIPEKDLYIKQGMIFVIAQKNEFLGNSVVEDKTEIKVKLAGLKQAAVPAAIKPKKVVESNCKNCLKTVKNKTDKNAKPVKKKTTDKNKKK